MQSFTTDIWTPGLSESSQSASSLNRRGTANSSGQVSRRPSTNSNPAANKSSTGTGAIHNSTGISSPKGSRRPSDASHNSNTQSHLHTAVGVDGKKHGILYRIFHPHDSESSVIGRSRRSYHSGSESDAVESEEEYASDASEGEGGPITFSRESISRSVKSLSRGGAGSVSESGDRPPMMSLSRRPSDANDSEESDAESPRLSIGRKGGNIFKDLLNGGRAKKLPSTTGANNTVGANMSPTVSVSDGNQSGASADSDSEVEHHSHGLFKGLMSHRQKPRKPGAASVVAVSNANATINVDIATKPPLPLPAPVSSSAAAETLHAAATGSLPRSGSETSLTEKYGKKEEVLGRGANAVVRLCCPLNSTKKYAIKEFRKRRKDETQKEYVKKLIGEFCISSTLEHPNVVRTIDLIQDERKQWCVVMEFCAGGDLYARIHSGTLTNPEEINCYFQQLVLGVKYLHSMGVAHKDLKPENLLLDEAGRVLKITDFGVSEVFRTPFGKKSKKAHGVIGSGPYIAPEEFDSKEYDSEPVDVWAIGIIFYVMVHNAIPWKSAAISDARFKHYLEHRSSFWPFDRLLPGPRSVLYRLLNPEPSKRITLSQLVGDDWFRSIDACTEGMPAEASSHTHIRTPTDK